MKFISPSHDNLLFLSRKIWVHISKAVPVYLNLYDIQHAIQINRVMEEDTFNVVVQVLHEDEVHRFGSTEFSGWRHFLNLDFAVSMQTYPMEPAHQTIQILNHSSFLITVVRDCWSRPLGSY